MISVVRDLVSEIEERAPRVAEEYVARMRERIGELVGDAVEKIKNAIN